MHRLELRKPNPALAPFVETLWYYDTDSIEMCPDLVLPHGAFELVIGLNHPMDHSVISGPQTKPMIVDPGSISPIVGAHFRPGGAAAFSGHAARAFRDVDVPLDDVWSRQAEQIHAELQDSPEPEHCLRRLEELLTRFALDAPIQHPAVSLAIEDFHRERPARRIRDLVIESGLSQRRFIELFTDRIGLPPKLYARIQRFQRTLHQVASQDLVEWSALASDFGYSDQAHLIRDFREFSGLRPTDYAPRMSDQPNHVPLS